VIEVEEVEKLRSLPVSTSVILTLYSLMMPFWLCRGGGDQAIKMDVGLSGVAVRFSGGLLGAVRKYIIISMAIGLGINTLSSKRYYLNMLK